MTDTKSIHYQHDEDGRIFLIVDGRSRQVLGGQTFTGASACAIVHALHEATRVGRRLGYGSAYTVEGSQVSVQHHPTTVTKPVPVYGLTPEQAATLAHELHQAGQMGAHS
jgi:hypothetical protein